MLDPFAQLFQHCWGHARSLCMAHKDLRVVFFPWCTAGPKRVGSRCICLHTTANTRVTTPSIVGATMLRVVAPVCMQANLINKLTISFLNRPITVPTRILVHSWGPRTRISGLFCRRTPFPCPILRGFSLFYGNGLLDAALDVIFVNCGLIICYAVCLEDLDLRCWCFWPREFLAYCSSINVLWSRCKGICRSNQCTSCQGVSRMRCSKRPRISLTCLGGLLRVWLAVVMSQKGSLWKIWTPWDLKILVTFPYGKTTHNERSALLELAAGLFGIREFNAGRAVSTNGCFDYQPVFGKWAKTKKNPLWIGTRDWLLPRSQGFSLK